jgi:membrane protease subunit HflC
MNGQHRTWTIITIIVLALILLRATFFAVDETEFVLVTQFGRPVRLITEAGFNAKLPFQQRRSFDKRLQVYNPRPSEFLTQDKKNLVLDNYVVWRIDNAELFLKTVGDPTGAEMRLHDIVWASLAAEIGNAELSQLVSTEPQQVQVTQLLDDVTAQCRRIAQQQFGIDIVDVRIKRLNLPEQNKEAVFARMRAERERIAKQYRAEGEEASLRIKSEADREKERILSEAYRDAERIKGDGDAQATRTYGAAYSRDPEFYQLVRTLQAYRKVIDDKTTAVLSSDSELLRLLTQGRPAKK